MKLVSAEYYSRPVDDSMEYEGDVYIEVTPIFWNEIRKGAAAFSKRWKNAYDEKGQAQSFARVALLFRLYAGKITKEG